MVVRILVLAVSVVIAADASRAEPELATPRRALRFFVDSARAHNFAAAAKALDLGDIPQEQWGEKGPQLARELELVLGQERRFDWDTVSDRPDGDSADGQGSDEIGTIPLGVTTIPIRLVRTPTEHGGSAAAWSPPSLASTKCMGRAGSASTSRRC